MEWIFRRGDVGWEVESKESPVRQRIGREVSSGHHSLLCSNTIRVSEVLVALSEPVIAWSSKDAVKACSKASASPLHLDFEFWASYECSSSGRAVLAGQRGQSNNRSGNEGQLDYVQLWSVLSTVLILQPYTCIQNYQSTTKAKQKHSKNMKLSLHCNFYLPFRPLSSSSKSKAVVIHNPISQERYKAAMAAKNGLEVESLHICGEHCLALLVCS